MFQVGWTLRSPNCAYKLVFQMDRNLVLYDQSNNVAWESGSTHQMAADSLLVNPDGNFLIYVSTDRAVLWSSNKASNKGPYKLRLLDNGALEVVGIDGSVIWNAGMGGILVANSYKTYVWIPLEILLATTGGVAASALCGSAGATWTGGSNGQYPGCSGSCCILYYNDVPRTRNRLSRATEPHTDSLIVPFYSLATVRLEQLREQEAGGRVGRIRTVQCRQWDFYLGAEPDFPWLWRFKMLHLVERRLSR